MTVPFYTRVALVGIAMYLFFEVLIAASLLAFEPLGALWYPLLVGGLAAAGGAAIYLWRPWGLVVGVLGGLIGIPFSLDSISSNLSSPDSFLDLAYRPLFWLGGTILVLGGSSAGLVQHFRGRTGYSGPALVSRAVVTLVAGAIVVASASLVYTIASIDRVSTEDRQGAMTLTMNGLHFEETALQVSAGEKTRLLIENDDPIVHTFTVEGLGIDLRVGPRGEKLLILDAPAGTYAYHCRVIGHEGMRGVLTVH